MIFLSSDITECRTTYRVTDSHSSTITGPPTLDLLSLTQEMWTAFYPCVCCGGYSSRIKRAARSLNTFSLIAFSSTSNVTIRPEWHVFSWKAPLQLLVFPSRTRPWSFCRVRSRGEEGAVPVCLLPCYTWSLPTQLTTRQPTAGWENYTGFCQIIYTSNNLLLFFLLSILLLLIIHLLLSLLPLSLLLLQVTVKNQWQQHGGDGVINLLVMCQLMSPATTGDSGTEPIRPERRIADDHRLLRLLQ